MGRLRWGSRAIFGLVLAACGSDSTAERREVSRLGQGCLLNSDCPKSGEACVFQRCHVECETKLDCKNFGFDTICLRVEKTEQGKAVDVSVCQLPEDELCGPQKLCPSPLVCSEQGKCRTSCSTSGDCGKSQTCVKNVCLDDEEPKDGGTKLCIYNSDCDAGLYCLSGVCTEQCKKDIDCPSGTSCVAEGSVMVCRVPSGTGGTGGGTGGTGGAPTLPPGSKCAQGGQCQSGVCVQGLCQAPSCGDFVKNGTETDIDCGGSCPGCPDGVTCSGSSDCASAVCGTAGTCDAPTCSDGTKNGAETGTDCGGLSSCGPCGAGQGCVSSSDCTPDLVCAPSSNPPAVCSPKVQLTVNLAGTGSGKVKWSGGGVTLDCPGACSVAVPQGSNVSITATADPGSTFTGFTPTCGNPCALALSADTSVTATFGGGAASGTWAVDLAGGFARHVLGPVSGGGVLGASWAASACGASLSLGAYLFRWDGNGNCVGTNTPKSLLGLSVDAPLGLGSTTTGDVAAAFKVAPGGYDWDGAFSCASAGFVTARFSGTSWVRQGAVHCRAAAYPEAAAVVNGTVVVVGGTGAGDDLGAGAWLGGRAFVAKYDAADGAFVQQYDFGTNARAYAVAAIGTDIAVGGVCDAHWQSPQWLTDVDGGANPCVVRLDASGNMVWTKTLNAAWPGSRVQAVAALGNDVVIVGRFSPSIVGLTATGNFDGFIAVLDGSTGEIKAGGTAIRTFGGSTTADEVSAVAVVGGQIWVGGFGGDVGFGPVTLSGTGVFVARFDSNLALVSATALGGGHYSYVTGLVPGVGGTHPMLAGHLNEPAIVAGTTITQGGFVTQLAP